MPLAEDVDLDDLARRTKGYTGADLENLVRKAGLESLRAGGTEAQQVTADAFERGFKTSRPSVTPETEEEYRKIAEELKQERPQRGRIGFTAQQ
jgi:transitional endoplasmic reticulum ATPase